MLNKSIPKYHTNVNNGFNIVAVSNKLPITKWKEFQRRPQTDEERKEQLELLHTGKANTLGFVCGIGGLVNIDIDAVDKDNPQSPPVPDTVPRDILANLGIAWPYTWAWRSASGKGWHIWLVVEDLPNDATRKENEKPKYNGVKAIEVRAWGHYSMIPASVAIPEEHPASTTWADVLHAVGIDERLKQKPPAEAKNTLQRDFAQNKLAEWVEKVATVPAGKRNDTLNLAAYVMGRLVGANLLDENEVRAQLFEAITTRKQDKDKVGEREANNTITSGLEAGKKAPYTTKIKAEGLVSLVLLFSELFVNQFNAPYAKVVEDDHFAYKRIESSSFKDWLITLYYEASEGKAIPNPDVLNTTIGILKQKAKQTKIRKGTYTRVAPDGNGGVYIDMCDNEWRAIHVTPNGWEIVTDPPVAFVRSDSMNALPEPQRGGSLDILRSLINIGGDRAWALTKAWLTTALLPEIPHCVLVLKGEQGSAKSTTVEFIRNLIDPSEVSLRRPPLTQEMLFITAKASWVVAYDNVSVIPDWLSDDICSLVTGTGISKRKLYTDDDELVMHAKRPFILNGITEFVKRGDLLDRALLIDVPYISDRNRKARLAIEAEFKRQHPYILGALLDRLAGSLREFNNVYLSELPRMADFTLYAVAAEKAEVGAKWSEDLSQFLKAYRDVRDTAKEQMLDSHVVGPVLRTWLSEAVLPWENTAAALLGELEQKAVLMDYRGMRSPAWPKTPRALRGVLNDLQPGIRGLGYEVLSTRKHKGRVLLIRALDTDGPDNTPTNDNQPPDTPPSGENPTGTPGNSESDREQRQHDAKEEAMRTIKQPASAYYKATQPIVWLETAQDVEEAMRDIMAQPLVGLDFETTTTIVGKKKNGEDAIRPDKLRLIQIATPTNVYILDAFKTDVHLLDSLFTAEEAPVLAGHNLKFELMMMQRTGLPIPSSNRLFDTMLASRLLTAGLKEKVITNGKNGEEKVQEKRLKHGLEDVAQRYLHKQVDKTLQKSNWGGELTSEQIQYAATDAAIMLPLSDTLGEKLYEADLTMVFEIEMRALPAVAWMEETGVFFNVAEWRNNAAKNQVELERLRNELAAVAGKDINWNSNKQVLPILKARGVDVDNTQEDTLKPFADKDPLVALFLAYKRLDHLVEHFDKEDMLHAITPDGRLHPNFDQTGTETGRMSCRDPNVQQIPRDGAYRKFFRAPAGRVLIKADYSQIELRIAAKITKDPRMLEAYKTKQDLHTLTAHLVLGVPLESVDKKHRQKAKALNFGLIYGMGARGLMNYAATQYGTHWTEEEAATFRNEFFKAYQGLRRWHQRTGQNKEPETVYTLSGRRRLNVAKFQEKLNTPVQGTGADGLKTALALLWETRHECPSAVPVLAVHDEIVIECDEAEEEKAQKWLERCMVDGMAWLLQEVPVVVESNVYKNWAGTDE